MERHQLRKGSIGHHLKIYLLSVSVHRATTLNDIQSCIHYIDYDVSFAFAICISK